MLHRLTIIILVGFALAACGSESNEAPSSSDPVLQAKADEFVSACATAAEDYGALVKRPECECIASSIVEYIEPERASKFFDDLTPLYRIEDDKSREDGQDRFWRDLMMSLTPEERPQWNEMLTEAFPVCRGEGEEQE